MQLAVTGACEDEEVVGLDDHVVELQQRQRLLAREPLTNGVEGEHAVDREMRPEVTQKIDVADAVQPFGVVHRDGIR